MRLEETGTGEREIGVQGQLETGHTYYQRLEGRWWG
jgi:hypothetical protein